MVGFPKRMNGEIVTSQISSTIFISLMLLNDCMICSHEVDCYVERIIQDVEWIKTKQSNLDRP